jgi:hypothetical protein
MENKSTLSIVFAIALVLSTFIGCVTVYNIRTNVIYADLIKNSQNPLAVRCAWNGDQQVCQIAGLRH